MIIQPKTKQEKIPVGSKFIPRLERAIQREMERFDVSRSFVIAEAVAFVLGVDLTYSYKGIAKERRK